MKNLRLLIFIFFGLCSIKGFSQTQKDTIEIYKGLIGSSFWKNGKSLTPGQLLDLTKGNPEAYRVMKEAKFNSGFANVLAFTGGFLIGYPLGAYIANGKPDWRIVGLGAGLVVFSIPFSVQYTKYAKKAVNIYNQSLRQKSNIFNKSDIKFGINPGGIGIGITF